MNALTRIGGFGLALAVLFGVSYVVGTTIGSSDEAEGAAGTGAHGHEISAEPDGARGDPAAAGLAISAGGYTLEPGALTWPAGRSRSYTFRILGPDGHPLTAFTRVHDADLHLIVVRRDLTGYQHLHPTRDAVGTWSVPLRLATPGVYRVFADFAPSSTEDGAGTGTGTGAGAGMGMGAGAGAGMGAAAGASSAPAATDADVDVDVATLTLGTDLTVGGNLQPAVLPAPSSSATVAGGYTVTLDGEASPDGLSDLAFSVTHAGKPVTDLEPYLNSLGHLVVLRQGDLAYLHVHPAAAGDFPGGAGESSGGPDGGMGDPTAGPEPGEPALSFATEFPSGGTYRLYLDFKHAGQVRTAEFTLTAPLDATAPTPTPGRTPAAEHAH